MLRDGSLFGLFHCLSQSFISHPLCLLALATNDRGLTEEHFHSMKFMSGAHIFSSDVPSSRP